MKKRCRGKYWEESKALVVPVIVVVIRRLVVVDSCRQCMVATYFDGGRTWG
jgi:hypothetical protein